MIPDVINIVFVDLDPLAYKDGTSSKAASGVVTKSRRKRKKHSSTTGSFQEQPVKDVEVEMPKTLFPSSLKIAALELLEALLIVVCVRSNDDGNIISCDLSSISS